MEDLLGSECSSGCESGWTLYLEQSYLSPFPSPGEDKFVEAKGVFISEGNRGKYEEEEEDLSMVSDASSGPPHFQEDEEYYGNVTDNGCFFYHAPVDATLQHNGGKRQKVKENRRRKVQEQLSLLDDTASSPLFNFSKSSQASMEDILDYSQGYSTTHFQGKSAFQEPYNFLQPN
ncbi:hypothetical protein RJ640_018630, partial [Escallonia rubra]